MSYELTLNIEEGSAAEHRIEELAQSEHISREDAALKLISAPPRPNTAASPAAMAILGAGREDAELIDKIMELIQSDKESQNAETLRV